MSAPLDEPPDPLRINFRRVELLREIMLRNGDGDTPVYITEFEPSAVPAVLAPDELIEAILRSRKPAL